MRDTKKLRRVLPISSPEKDGRGYNDYPIRNELSRAKKLSIAEKRINDSWSKLLGERQELSNLYYENGSWNVSEEVRAARETREGIIWDNIPGPRSKAVIEDELLELIRKSEYPSAKSK